MEYYYLDRLRWNFGFENPNHAAAFIASSLPFVWALGRAVQFQRPLFRFLGGLLAAGGLIAGWWLLGMTLSRGGLVAAVGGFAIIAWKTFPEWKTHWLRPLLVTLAIAGVVGITGLGERASEGIVRPDASIENRLEVWKGGLQMLAIAPLGVGGGKSGEFYMHWVQPTDSTAGYRTLVNGYMTYLTEYGLVAGFAVLGILILWGMGIRPERGLSSENPWILASAASLASFAIAACFSTTFETATVWIAPLLAVTILTGAGLRTRSWQGRPSGRLAVDAAVLSAGILLIWWSAGMMLGANKDLQLSFYDNGAILVTAPDAKQTWVVLPDEAVAGADYGKRLRELASAKNLNLKVVPPGQHVPKGDGVIVMGKRIDEFSGASTPLVLIAPAAGDSAFLEKCLEHAPSLRVLNPGFDEDGRVGFWNEMLAGHSGKSEVVSFEGFGNDLTQTWAELVAKIRLK